MATSVSSGGKCEQAAAAAALNAKKELPAFNSYMSLFQVQEKLKKGEVIEGVLRINPKNYEDAYISAPGGGTDIYIGGVRDRNAALHGDRVALELQPSQHWKVLYDQLDFFLESDKTLKDIVYAEHDPFAVMDEFVPPGCVATKEQHNMDDQSLPNNDDDDANTEDNSAMAKKKKRRGKKNKKKADDGEVMPGDEQQPPDNFIQDKVVILSSNIDAASVASSVIDEGNLNKKSKKKVVIVPPDMLSECSDITDDESVCSDSIDLDCAIEDRAFYNAQRAAAAAAKKAANAQTPGVALVKQEHGANDDKPQMEHEVEQSKKKKRISTAESLFGHKIKKQDTSPAQNEELEKKPTPEESITKTMSNIEIASNADVCKEKHSTVKEDLEPSKKECAESNDVSESMSSQSNVAQKEYVAPPQFMVSPYNQQVNYSCAQARAENNWLNHPMLNSFGINPSQSNMRPQKQQPVNQKYQQQNRNKGSTGREVNEKRTVPTVAQVMRLSNWGRFVQKVAYVVHILEVRNTRLGAGMLKPFADNNRNFALFSPNDNRIPRMKIPMSQCPPDLLTRRNEYAKKIYLAKIIRWNDPKFALGELIRDIGCQGDIVAEAEAFLLQVGIDYSPFPEEVIQELPKIPSTGWKIPEEALAGRKDFRNDCIFSIDPATARDLDDALSCEVLPGNRYRVGVHIADVSYFVPFNTNLDTFAASRATSVYLVDQVIPMLPRVLCEQLCSLNPDEDRLAFSVVWEMDRFGNVQSTWFGRSIIRSCGKLAYDHAQSVIDNPGKCDWAAEEMPTISRFPLSKVCEVITTLQLLAVQMRSRRHANGALRLDQKKLCFDLDKQTKMPNAVQTTEHKPSNNLIEEFMLLANISVAHKINESFPEYAVLRCHPQPQEGQLSDVTNLLRTLNIDIDSASAGTMYSSVLSYSKSKDFPESCVEVIVNMLSKPMQNALYFCAGTWKEDFSHYALNVPFYTHFTSPIRRYPDILVHRLLAAAIDEERYPLSNMDHDEIDRRLSVSNEKKMTAKRASEYSAELYLAEFVRRCNEIYTEGIVIGVLDRALDILLIDYCTIKRAYLDKLPVSELNFDNKNKSNPPTINLVWNPDHVKNLPSIAQSFTYFSNVKVLLTPFTNDQLKFNVTLLRSVS